MSAIWKIISVLVLLGSMAAICGGYMMITEFQEGQVLIEDLYALIYVGLVMSLAVKVLVTKERRILR